MQNTRYNMVPEVDDALKGLNAAFRDILIMLQYIQDQWFHFMLHMALTFDTSQQSVSRRIHLYTTGKTKSLQTKMIFLNQV